MKKLIFYLFTLIQTSYWAVNGNTTEYDISSQLLLKYDQKILPTNLMVHMKITLQQIVNIDELNQIMTTNSIIELHWTDKILQFSNTSGINEVLMPALSL